MPAAIQAVPITRAPSCSATTLIQTEMEKTAPKTVGSGTCAPRIGIERGTRKALGRSGSRKRSAITDRCASANAIIAP